MVNTPIGNPWEMLAVDILEVPLSRNNHPYLLVVMDYFTKWADAIPLRDQKAATVANAVVLESLTFYILTRAGILKALCSTRYSKHLAFTKHRPLPTIPKVMVWWSVLIAHCYSYSGVMLTRKMIGNVTYRWYFMLIGQHNIPQLVYHHFSLCLQTSQPGSRPGCEILVINSHAAVKAHPHTSF